MILLVAAALALLCALVVVYPFLKSRTGEQGEPSKDSSGLEEIYDAIRTVHLERQLGKIPEGEYQELLKAYRFQAATVLRDLAHAGFVESRDPETALEQEILAARAVLPINSVSRRCQNCGAPVDSGLAKCPQCRAEPVIVVTRAPEVADW